MASLAISIQSLDWKLVEAYIHARRQEILERMDDLSLTEQERRDCAVRRDELILLLGAPMDTREAAEIAHNAIHTPTRSVY